VASGPDFGDAISILKNIRIEKEKFGQLEDELRLEEQELDGKESRKKFLLQKRDELFMKNRTMTPESLLMREEKELTRLQAFVQEELPEKIKITERRLLALKQAETMSLQGRLDLNDLRKKVSIIQ
jgi:hypothetical protein